jgi:hypothetical protein
MHALLLTLLLYTDKIKRLKIPVVYTQFFESGHYSTFLVGGLCWIKWNDGNNGENIFKQPLNSIYTNAEHMYTLDGNLLDSSHCWVVCVVLEWLC